MALANFDDQELFTKGVAYAEFFSFADELVAYSRYVTDFGMNGSQNDGDIEGGIGNQLIMSIPDTSRLEITAQTANGQLGMLGLPVGEVVGGNGIIETMTAITATGTGVTLTAPTGCVAPYGAENGPMVYIIGALDASGKKVALSDTGSPRYIDENGKIAFYATEGYTYCVKYWVRNSSAEELAVPANFAPSIVRAHFAVNVYAKSGSGDAMSGSLVKIRHYYIPRYQFNQPLQITESQTTPGTTNLGGRALSYADAVSVCANAGKERYAYIVDEFVGGDGTATYKVQGIYFVGTGGSLSITDGEAATVTVKYDIGGQLTQVSDADDITMTVGTPAMLTVTSIGNGVYTVAGNQSGSTTLTASVTNALTGEAYTDTIQVAVSAA